jgi:hypothetical protein
VTLPQLILVTFLLNDADLWRDQVDALHDIARPVALRWRAFCWVAS